MWILPKQLHTSDFVPDTAALSLDCTESSQICAQSLFVRSKASSARTWSQKWKRDSWTQHLYGRILNPSHGQSFVTAWTSSLGDIPASHSAQPESASAQTTHDTSGLLSQTEFGFCDPNSASLKMSKDTSPSDSEKSLESWNQSVTKRRGEYSVRLKSAHRTSASGSSSWPTIRASEYKDTGPIGSKSHDHMPGKGYLCAVVTQDAANWPTPCAMEAEKAGLFDKGQMGQSLSAMANRGELGLPAPEKPSTDGSRQGLWPTITAHTPDIESSGPNGNSGTYLAGAVKDAANWPTPDASNHRDGAVLRTDNNLEQGGFHGVSLHHAMTKYGLPAPEKPSTDGSRQGLSEQSQRNWQTFAHGTHNRGETPHRQVVRALVTGEKAKTQCLTVDQVFAEEIKGTNRQESWATPRSCSAMAATITEESANKENRFPNLETQVGRQQWATPQASDHVEGARTELTSNQKCLGRDMKQWATPRVGGEEKAETRLARAKDIGQHGQVGAMNNTAKLNSRWVETLMGLPIGWTMPSCKLPVTIEPTNCASSATESCLQQPSELLEF